MLRRERAHASSVLSHLYWCGSGRWGDPRFSWTSQVPRSPQFLLAVPGGARSRAGAVGLLIWGWQSIHRRLSIAIMVSSMDSQYRVDEPRISTMDAQKGSKWMVAELLVVGIPIFNVANRTGLATAGFTCRISQPSIALRMRPDSGPALLDLRYSRPLNWRRKWHVVHTSGSWKTGHRSGARWGTWIWCWVPHSWMVFVKIRLIWDD